MPATCKACTDTSYCTLDWTYVVKLMPECQAQDSGPWGGLRGLAGCDGLGFGSGSKLVPDGVRAPVSRRAHLQPLCSTAPWHSPRSTCCAVRTRSRAGGTRASVFQVDRPEAIQERMDVTVDVRTFQVPCGTGDTGWPWLWPWLAAGLRALSQTLGDLPAGWNPLRLSSAATTTLRRRRRRRRRTRHMR